MCNDQSEKGLVDWMAKIRTKLGIKHAVTYVARHTFPKVLKKAGVSIEYIREALGHTSIQSKPPTNPLL